MSAETSYETTYARLKNETAAMFGLNIEKLSLLDELRLDLISLLRLEVGSLQGKALAGQTIDLDRLNTAHNMLAKLLPPSTLVTEVDEISTGEEAQIEGQWARHIAGITAEHERQLAEDPGAARQRLEDEIAAAVAKYGKPEKPPWGGSAPPPSTEPAPTEPTTGSTTLPSASASPSTKTPGWPPPNSPPQLTPEHLLRTTSPRPPQRYLRSVEDERIAYWGSHFL
jgi:hypothetical protein